MKPYYTQDGITIYHGDCREVLGEVSADVVVTDPPYGVGIEYASYDDTQERLRDLVTAVAPTFGRFSNVALTSGVKHMSLWPTPDWVMCWHCPSNTGRGPWGFTTWQPILVYGPDPYLKRGLGSRPDSVSTPFGSTKMAEQEGASGHPTPKPISFMRWLIQRVSFTEQVIADPFMGSGTTLRAAKDLGRKAIGIEINERYCEIAAKRLAQGVLALDGTR